MIPSRHEIKKAIVSLLETHEHLSPQQCYKLLAKQFHLSDEDLSELTNDKKGSRFELEVRWARKDLVQEKILLPTEKSGYGIWKLAIKTKPLLTDDALYALSEARKKLKENLNPVGQVEPEKSEKSVFTYNRDINVVAKVLQFSNGICELCEKKSPFIAKDGLPYLEVHHVRHLADGGSDTIFNAIAVCPNCHKELHYGINSDSLVSLIYKKILRVMPE